MITKNCTIWKYNDKIKPLWINKKITHNLKDPILNLVQVQEVTLEFSGTIHHKVDNINPPLKSKIKIILTTQFILILFGHFAIAIYIKS